MSTDDITIRLGRKESRYTTDDASYKAWATYCAERLPGVLPEGIHVRVVETSLPEDWVEGGDDDAQNECYQRLEDVRAAWENTGRFQPRHASSIYDEA